MEQIIWGSWVVGGGREEVMCLWNGPPTLIGREQKNGSQSWLVDNKNPPLPALNLSLRIFFLRLFFLSAISPQSVNENLFLTLLFLSSIIMSIHICWNSFPKVTGMLTWLLFSPQICHFGSRPSFRTRPIFCQTLRLWTFENYLLVESAFVVRNSRTLFSKLAKYTSFIKTFPSSAISFVKILCVFLFAYNVFKRDSYPDRFFLEKFMQFKLDLQ